MSIRTHADRPSHANKLLPLLFLALFTNDAIAHETGRDLGEIDFPVSCNLEAQHEVTEGTLLLHHMMYVQAHEKFELARAADPTCVMAEWGIAMSQFHPMWPGGQSDIELATGVAAMERAAALDPGTDRENAYLRAVAAFYDKATAPYPERLAAWAERQQAVFASLPDDIDAGAFAALAMLSTASPADHSYAVQREAGAMIERLHSEAPLHPGLFHYAIHAYDHPPLAPLAERFAEGYDKIAPEVPHALHMPSHIFVRLGRWPEGAEWNRRSAAAALDQPMPDGVISNHYPHAVDYLAYSLLQMGEIEEARAVVQALLTTPALQENFGSAYALAASPARIALEREDWTTAAALPTKPHDSIVWAKFPQASAIVWFARGVGAARSGDDEGAREALAEIDALRTTMESRGMAYWVTLANAQAASIEAWRTYGSGKTEMALKLMRQAAEIEDSVGKAPVTPGHVLPARELLGDMLRDSGQPEEAIAAYDAALQISPNRRRSVEGRAKAMAEAN